MKGEDYKLMPDMKKGIRGNKLGEGYGKAELADRIRGFVAEREAKDLAMKQMEAEIEALIQAEQEKKRKQAEELKKREGISAIRNRVAERNSRRFNLYLDEMDRKEWNNAYLDYLEGQEISDWKTATEEMISTPIMTRVEFEAMQEKQDKMGQAVSSYTETPVIDEVVAENEESVVEINDISVEEVVADFYETDAVLQESKAEEQIVDVVLKAEKSEQIDYTELSLEERARILPAPTDDFEAEFKAFKERMGYVGAKLASIQYKMEIYDEFREEYDYRNRCQKVEEVRTADRSRGAR